MSVCGFRLRVAQSLLRHDLTPSHWSHVALVGHLKDDLASTVVHEISLEPPGGFRGVPPSNALQRGTLGEYADPRACPNIGIITVPVSRQSLEEPLVKFQHQRAILDGPQLVLLWLAYVWGAGGAENPLQTGNGIPSAAMVEVVIGAAGLDLTPGVESRASCPEAIYQSAKWWEGYYKTGKRKILRGAYYVGHRMDFYPSACEEARTAGVSRTARATPPKETNAYEIADPE